jgi:hypothetical protein
LIEAETLAKPLVNQRLGTASPSRFGYTVGLFNGGRTCGEPQKAFAKASAIKSKVFAKEVRKQESGDRMGRSIKSDSCNAFYVVADCYC